MKMPKYVRNEAVEFAVSANSTNIMVALAATAARLGMNATGLITEVHRHNDSGDFVYSVWRPNLGNCLVLESEIVHSVEDNTLAKLYYGNSEVL